MPWLIEFKQSRMTIMKGNNWHETICQIYFKEVNSISSLNIKLPAYPDRWVMDLPSKYIINNTIYKFCTDNKS